MKIPGRLAFIDFEKAFDSLEWEFIFKTLKYFNLGHDIIRWVKVFYTEMSSCIINNGVFSKTFDILRGVRQGCPLSPYLFVLCVEILAIAIRRDTSVKGINIQNIETKISQFADDTTLILNDDDSSLINAFTILDRFYEISGLMINCKKTEIMGI